MPATSDQTEASWTETSKSIDDITNRWQLTRRCSVLCLLFLSPSLVSRLSTAAREVRLTRANDWGLGKEKVEKRDGFVGYSLLIGL
jgi:hypothetical protein